MPHGPFGQGVSDDFAQTSRSLQVGPHTHEALSCLSYPHRLGNDAYSSPEVLTQPCGWTTWTNDTWEDIREEAHET